ncbi:MAG: hypothetical protein JWO38_4452 [Gemmataceae bacterium]|nr:hypothetical protein [Gemmataceae bacterium]
MAVGAPSPQPGDRISRADAGHPVGLKPAEHRGAELWSSKALNLAWLPRCDNRHNPCLLSEALPEAVFVENPVPPTFNRRPVWFWRVEPVFGAWVVRAIHRAGLAKADLPKVYEDLFPVLKRYLEDTHPGRWPGVERLARAGPVLLPGAEIIAQTVEMARYGFAPRWSGWDKLAAERNFLAGPEG